MAIDNYESAIQPQGRFGAVYERDDDTAYFYLLDLDRLEASRVIGAFCVTTLADMSPTARMSVDWTPEGDLVGLFADRQLLVVFDLADLRADACLGRRAGLEERRRFASA